MRHILLTLAFTWILAVANVASASVITFDDLSNLQSFSGSYEGFDWGDNWFAVDEDYYQGVYNNSYGAVSSRIMASNSAGFREITTMSGDDFDFVGMHATGWAEFDDFAPFTSTTITVEGWDDGAMVGSVTVDLSADQFDWVAAGFSSIDTLVFKNDGQNGRWWLIDDFEYNLITSNVPEPTSAMVWFAGLGLLGFRRRR